MMNESDGPSAWKTTAVISAMTAVWITTAGHTMNFREMEAARGWIASEGYSLHTAYLLSLVLGLLYGYSSGPKYEPFSATVAGLFLLAAGSLINGTQLTAPLTLLAASRAAAGFGGGLVLVKAPALHEAVRANSFAWAGIVLPSVAPLIVAVATFHYGWSNWEGAFLFEFAMATAGLCLVMAAGKPFQQISPLDRKITFPWWMLPLAAAMAAGWYVLHWGQLEGWIDSAKIKMALLLCALGSAASIGIAPAGLPDWRKVAPPAAVLVALFAGFTQYFNVSDMGVYGGLFVNFGVWERALLVWPISCGAALALVVARFCPNAGWFAITGLLLIAAGMGLAHGRTMDWPYWRMLNQAEFNWFPAPQVRELWMPRFLMGLGTGLAFVGAQRMVPVDPDDAARGRHLLTVVQIFGGALSIGALCLCLTRGYQNQYSFVSEKGFIQETAIREYTGIVSRSLAESGFQNASHAAETLAHRAISYEANNLVFANLYGWFAASAVTMAAIMAFIPGRKKDCSFSRGQRS